MKKLSKILVSTVMPMTVLVGCGDDSSNEDTGANSASASETNGGTDSASGGETDSASGGETDSATATAGETDTGPAGCGEGGMMEISADIEGDMTLGCENVWVLTDLIFVRNGTLTIEPGTVIRGTEGSALIIDTSATIDAQGTEDAPIVMTSIQQSPGRGDWGGLVLLGNATNNLAGGVGQAEGFANPPSYGGNDDSHDCGTLSYLRVEWAGFAIAEGSELNGITFYSCGSDTSVDHVQVHMGADDGIEMFGGNFDAKYLIVTGAEDDSIDCDEGYQGRLQHVFIHQDPVIGDNVFEWSNQGTDYTATPHTRPVVANLTAIGSGGGGDKSKGVTLKEGTEAEIYSSIFTGITNQLVLLQNIETQTLAENGAIGLAGNVLHDHGGFGVDSEGDVTWSAEDFEMFVMDPANGNVEADPMLTRAEWASPDITPVAGSPAESTAATPAEGWWDATTYAGAVDPAGDNWTLAPWTNYGV